MALGFRKDITQIDKPSILKGLRDIHVVQLSASKYGFHNLVLSQNGEVYAFGTSPCGALGLDYDDLDNEFPVETSKDKGSITRLVSRIHFFRQRGLEQKLVYLSCKPTLLRITKTIPVKHVECGGRHSVFITDDGLAYTFGDNSRGQLGLGQDDILPSDLIEGESKNPTGTQVTRKQAKATAARYGDMVNNNVIQAKRIWFITEPVLMSKIKFRVIKCGEDHSIGVGEDGVFYGWGANCCGQLGLGSLLDVYTPTGMVRLKGEKYIHLALGAKHTLCLSQNQHFGYPRLQSFGSNSQGQLGTGIEDDVRVYPSPLDQSLFKTQNLKDVREYEHLFYVAAASNHSFAVNRKWGSVAV